MYKIDASTTTKKSYIVVQALSIEEATYYCFHIVADCYARWLGTTNHV